MKRFIIALALCFVAGIAKADGDCKEKCASKARACHAWCTRVEPREYEACEKDCKKEDNACTGQCSDE